MLSVRTGTSPILREVGDYELELPVSVTLDGRTQVLGYQPTPH